MEPPSRDRGLAPKSDADDPRNRLGIEEYLRVIAPMERKRDEFTRTGGMLGKKIGDLFIRIAVQGLLELAEQGTGEVDLDTTR